MRINQKTRSRHFDDFMDSDKQLNVLVTPLLKSDQEPPMMAPLDVILLIRSYFPTTLELSLVTGTQTQLKAMKGLCEVSKKWCAHKVDLHHRA